ncbi:hypothetical protein H7171_01230 [Candidatus Saccharibacteria bacterium]|nr:hypothetical protein [Candidatus Saccharibacteria bacterium]
MNFRRLLKKSSAAFALVLLVGFGFSTNNVHGLAQPDPQASTSSPVNNTMYHSYAASGDTMTTSDQQMAQLGSAATGNSSAPTFPAGDQKAKQPVSASRSLAIIIGSMIVASMVVVLIFYIVLSRKRLPTSKKAAKKPKVLKP